jgi:hypothetical protein
MSVLILKFVSRLYKLLKIYSTIALLGALGGIVVGITVEKPIVLVLVAPFIVVSAASMIVLLMARSHERPGQSLLQHQPHELQNERPPILLESLLIVSLPSELAGNMIGDLGEEFDHLRSKYGRYSAVTWYTVQSWTIFVKAMAFHLGLSFGKSLASERTQIYVNKR